MVTPAKSMFCPMPACITQQCFCAMACVSGRFELTFVEVITVEGSVFKGREGVAVRSRAGR